MNDSFESELRRFSPAQASPELQRGIAAAIEHASTQRHAAPMPAADRRLISAMVTGLAAAIAIVAMLGSDPLVENPNYVPLAAKGGGTATPVAAQTGDFLALLSSGKDPTAPRVQP